MRGFHFIRHHRSGYMVKKLVSIMCLCILLIVEGAAWIAQHLACFDVFDSNLWYLYFLAVVFAVLQWIVLFFIGKIIQLPTLFYICLTAYILGMLAYSFGFIAWILSGCNSWGLMLLCVGLDTIGALISYHRISVMEYN